jgi:hypothetical protein
MAVFVEEYGREIHLGAMKRSKGGRRQGNVI